MRTPPEQAKTPVDALCDQYKKLSERFPLFGSQRVNVGTLPEYQDAPALLDLETGFGLGIVTASLGSPMVCAFRMDKLDKNDIHITVFKPASVIQTYRTGREALIDLFTMLANTRIRSIVG